MAKSRDERARGRFSKSGHTSHPPRVTPPQDPPTQRYPTQPNYQPPPSAAPRHQQPPYQQPPYQQPPYQQPPYQQPPYQQPPYQHGQYHQPPYHDPGYHQPYAPPPAASGGARSPGGFGSPTYHHTPGGGRRTAPERPATAGEAALFIGRSAITQTNRAARAITRKVISASKADGAEESGLTALIWNQVLNYGADAMVTVALASTVFFGASTHAQRGNVLLYLLVTMAPFAVVAPIIGPALDRLQHGRRWTMAATAIGRAVLALVMAAHATDLLVLYPCALGSLVCSKAYAVLRASAAPRLVPPGMTLTEANARVSIFGLGSTLIMGGFVGLVIKVTGSYGVGLVATAIGFAACAVFAFKLPKQVDSASAAPRHPQEPPRPRSQQRVPARSRLQSWAKRGFDPNLIVALQGESALRMLSGLLTIYLALYVEATQRGFTAVADLGLVVGAAGVGNFLGNAIGTRLKLSKPEMVIVISVLVSGVLCLVVTISFGMLFAAVAFLVASTGNSLSKIALDALIQRDVVETLRSSAFARSETFLQLAWVAGAAIGVALPGNSKGDGAIGFLIAGVLVVATGVFSLLRTRTMGRMAATRATRERPAQPGSVSVD